MSEKIWSDEAWADYLYWQTQDKKTLKKINELIKDIERNGPIEGTGQPEALKKRILYLMHMLAPKSVPYKSAGHKGLYHQYQSVFFLRFLSLFIASKQCSSPNSAPSL
jgi:hypothetical protein